MTVRIKSKAVSGLIVLMAVVLLSSCDYKDFGCPPSPRKVNVLLHFDWKAVDSIPKSMRVVFYPEHYETYAQGYTFFDVLNRDTVIQISTGKYNITSWNLDTEYVITSGFSRQPMAYATTGSYSPHGNETVPAVLDSIFPGQRVIDYPDYMVHGNLRDCMILNDTTITVPQDSMVVTVEVRFNGIRHTELVENVRGTISNVAARRYMSYDNQTEESVAVMFDGNAPSGEDRLTARFWIFGKEPTDEGRMRHKIVMFVWLKGGQVFIPVDVTDVMAKYSRDDKYILIDTKDLNIDLLDYLRSGGMTVAADDWESTKEIEIEF